MSSEKQPWYQRRANLDHAEIRDAILTIAYEEPSTEAEVVEWLAGMGVNRGRAAMAVRALLRTSTLRRDEDGRLCLDGDPNAPENERRWQ